MSYIYHATPQADREMLPFLPAALQSLAKRFNWKLSEDSGSISLAMADRPSWRTVTIDKTTGRVAYDTDYAELKTEVESLRALTYRAVESYVGGKDVTKLASMAKLKAGRLSREVADSCLQYWGGMGFTWDNPLARAYRDGRLASIGGGADEVMLGIICKLMGTLPGKKR